jgi:hypothetical protein
MGPRMKRLVIRTLSALVCLPIYVNAQSRTPWFQRRVVWQAGEEPRVWDTTIGSPDGRERYRLALIPLWALEGGIVAMEILIARPEHPEDNLLGERQLNLAQPFVITVEELERGINKSRFGTRRDFKLQGIELRAEIQGSRLGEGVGDCRDCKNIQELTVDFALRSSEKKLQTTAKENLVRTNWHKLNAGPFSIFAPSGWEFRQSISPGRRKP